MHPLAVVSLVVLAGSLAACQPASLPRATTTTAGPLPDYRIQEGDELSVKYYYTPEMNDIQVVRSDGKISLTYLPNVTAAGLTIPALHDQLVASYAAVLREPVITVAVTRSSAGRVFVGGEVNRPGEMDLGGRASLVQMLFKAGGLKPTAAGNRVVLIRRGADGDMQRTVLDADGVLDGNDAQRDIRLQPYDVVYVPPTTIAQIDRAVDQYLHQIVPIGFTAQYVVRDRANQVNNNAAAAATARQSAANQGAASTSANSVTGGAASTSTSAAGSTAVVPAATTP